MHHLHEVASSAICVLHTRYTLRHINLEGCAAITDKTMEYLTGNCTGVTALNLVDCPLLSDAGVTRVGLTEESKGGRQMKDGAHMLPQFTLPRAQQRAWPCAPFRYTSPPPRLPTS